MPVKPTHINLFSTLFIVLFAILGCNPERQLSKKSLKHFERGEYELVIQLLKSQADKNTPGDKSAYWVAESYRLSNRIGQALPYYQKASQIGIEDPLINYHMALSAKSMGNYELCKTIEQILAKQTEPLLSNKSRNRA
jgi:hypothetical protein